jgi:hypothetical protein
MADNSTYDPAQWATSTGGLTQEQLLAMWNKAGEGAAFNNQGSEALDQSGGARAANSRWVPDGDDNRENDFYVQQNPDGSFGRVDIMRHGFNGEFATFALPILTAGAATAYGVAGGAASGAGTVGSEAAAAGAGGYGSAVPTLSAAEIGNPLYGTAEAWASGGFPAINVGEAAAAGGAAGAAAGGGSGGGSSMAGGETINGTTYNWDPTGYTGGTPELAGGGGVGGGSSWLGNVGTSDWLKLGGSLLNGYLGQKAADKAAQAQIAASRDAIGLQKYMYDQTRQDNMPALQARNNGLAGYQNLLANPSKITSDPGYQFGLDQGTKAIGSQAAAKGGYYSGATLKALDKFGQDYGGSKFDQALNRHGNLAGLGQVGTSQIGQAGQNYANQAGQSMIGAGDARGAASMAGYNAWNQSLNNLLGYSQYRNQYPYGG